MSTELAGPPKPESGPPPQDSNSSNPSVRAVERAVDKLETARGFIERDLELGRGDMRDVRDRLARIETKVGDLPSKTWIGVAVLGGMTFLSALVAILAAVFTHIK